MFRYRWLTVLWAALLMVQVVGCGDDATGGAPCEGYTACGEHGTCDDSTGEALCQCDVGYAGSDCAGCDTGYQDYGDGECLSSDPCAGTTVCEDMHRECVNDQGTAVCGACLAGFMDYGDGECLSSDPCAGTTVCEDMHRECVNDQGTAVCGACLTGFMDYGDGACRTSDPCATDTLCVAAFRECVNDQGTAVCGDCILGYYDDGGVCVEGCVPTHHAGVPVALDLYLLLDKSSSMTDAGKWTTMITGLSDFITSADASGVGIGVQYFPVLPSAVIPTTCTSDPDCGLYGPCMPGFNQCGGSFATDTSCDPADYNGADVPITTLPGGVGALQTSLSGHTPDGSATPTQPSLEGGIAYVTDWQQSNPSHATRVVMITDGEPTGCTYNSVTGAAQAAAMAAAGNPQILTYVVGLGSSLTSLNDIAAAGGTGQARIAATAADIQDALVEIRARELCYYQIPAAVTSSGDYQLVDLALTDPASPPDATDITPVADATSCDPVTGGWHFDTATSPTEIRLCGSSCDMLMDHSLEVDILVGCDPTPP